ncbi:epoxyqueuosine reductase [Actinomycetes bacterium]|nr:epoxyqueuosine reductase [Actinomycetes bacterium]
MPEWCLRFGIVQLAKKPETKSSDSSPELKPAKTPAISSSRYAEQLVSIGITAGLHRVGITGADVLHRAREVLTERKSLGLHNEMQFTYRNPARSTDPTSTMPTARSIIVGARSYATETPIKPDQISARIARYAWADYYELLRFGLAQIAAQLKADGWRAIILADDNSLVDREVAYQAGLGWYGKNANLLIEGAGSYFVLGSVLTDAPLAPSTKTVEDGCGSCRRCIDNCPTQAIVAPGVVDARKCLAWLLQKPGVFDSAYRIALGDRLYGCDDCQEVCPPTVRHAIVEEQNGKTQAWASVMSVLNLDDKTLLENFKAWYISDRDPKWLRRNALIILGNVANASDQDTQNILKRYLVDREPILRAHAVWAAARLGLKQFLPTTDSDPIVQAELDSLPSVK